MKKITLIYHDGQRTPIFTCGHFPFPVPPTMGGFLLGRKYPVFVGYIINPRKR